MVKIKTELIPKCPKCGEYLKRNVYFHELEGKIKSFLWCKNLQCRYAEEK